MPRTAQESPSLQSLADACVQCGLCLPVCPTYADQALETESPRGRVLLAKAIGQGRIGPAEADASAALSHCLGCRACEAACPAGVEYGLLLHQTRAALRREAPPPGWQRVIEWLLLHPRLLGQAMHLTRWLRRLPGLRARIPALPRPGALPDSMPEASNPRGRLALVQGCVAAHAEGPAHRAALRLLGRLGWEVVVVPAACCGALHRHAGAEADASALTERLAALIARTGASMVLHAGSGCHEAIGEAAGTLPTQELSTFIAQDAHLDRLTFSPCSERVALHVACTQRTVVRHPGADRTLLERIPGLVICAPAPEGCCGAAGIQSLRFPAQSEQRMRALRDWYRAAEPDRVLAGNLGCRWQLARQLAPGHGIIEAEHPLVFLDRHLL